MDPNLEETPPPVEDTTADDKKTISNINEKFESKEKQLEDFSNPVKLMEMIPGFLLKLEEAKPVRFKVIISCLGAPKLADLAALVNKWTKVEDARPR